MRLSIPLIRLHAPQRNFILKSQSLLSGKRQWIKRVLDGVAVLGTGSQTSFEWIIVSSQGSSSHSVTATLYFLDQMTTTNCQQICVNVGPEQIVTIMGHEYG